MFIVYVLQLHINSDIYLYLCHNRILIYNNNKLLNKTLILQNVFLLQILTIQIIFKLKLYSCLQRKISLYKSTHYIKSILFNSSPNN